MGYIGRVPADFLSDLVDSSSIVDGSIITADIANDAITTAKLATNSVDSAEIIDGSVDNSHLAGSIAMNKTLLAGGTGLTLSTNTLNVDAAQTQITSLGTIAAFRSTGIDDNADALAITIDSSERVGIRATPLYPLHVNTSTNKNFMVRDSVAPTGGVMLQSVNDADSAATAMEFRGSLFSFQVGRVGIGTTTPNATLHIGSTASFGTEANPAIQIGESTGYRGGLYTDSEGLFISNKNGDDGVKIQVRGNVAFQVDDNQQTNMFGNADVVGNLTAGTIASDAGISGTTGTFSGILSSNSHLIVANGYSIKGGSGQEQIINMDGTTINIGGENNIVNTGTGAWTFGGNVEINGSSLTVDSTGNAILYMDGGDANYSGVWFGQLGDKRWEILNHPTADKLYFNSNSGGDGLVVIDQSGKVGIGVTDPDEKLEVAGASHFGNRIDLYPGGNSTKMAILGSRGDIGSGAANITDLVIKQLVEDKGIALQTYDGVVMYIEDGGNVGIGTTDPTRLLHLKSSGGTWQKFESEHSDNWLVGANSNGMNIYNESDARYDLTFDGDGDATFAGNVDVTGNLSSSDNIWVDQGKSIYYDGGSNTYINSASADHLNFWTGGNNVFTLGDNATFAGNVGIGATPVTALDIHSSGVEVAGVFGMADDGNVWVATRTAETQNSYGAYSFMVGSTAVDGVGSTNTTAYISSAVVNSSGLLKGNLKFYTNAGQSLTHALTLDESQNATFAGTITANNGYVYYGTGGEYIYSNNTHLYIVSTDDLNLNVAGNTTIDTAYDINLDSDQGNTYFKDGGTQYGALKNSSGNLIIQSGSTTMLTGSGANATFAGTVRGTGVFYGNDNGASNPGYRFYNAASGMYHAGSDNIGFAVSGNNVATLTASSATFAGDISVSGGNVDINSSALNAVGDLGDADDYAIVIRQPYTTGQGTGIAFANDGADHIGGAIVHIDRGSNNLGDLAFYTKSGSTGAPSLALTLDSSQNATFAGDVSINGKSGSTNLYIKNSESWPTNADKMLHLDFDNNTANPENDGYFVYAEDKHALKWSVMSNGNATFAGNVTGKVGYLEAPSGLALNLDTASSNQNCWVTWNDNGTPKWEIGKNTAQKFYIHNYAGNESALVFDTSSNATFAGIVGIGHTTPQYGLTLAQGTSDSGKIGWEDAGNNKRGAIFVSSANDRMEFMTGTSDTVRMSIFSDGLVNINTTSQWNLQCQRESGSSQGMILFTNGGSNVGSIISSTTGTSYNEDSDYRLKENEVAISDGITRLKQLKPYKFNFKVTPDTTVDGFFAHEVQEVVPQAITGVKDAVDEKGNIESQQIDHSKLVPLLVSALQEALDRIEALENA